MLQIRLNGDKKLNLELLLTYIMELQFIELLLPQIAQKLCVDSYQKIFKKLFLIILGMQIVKILVGNMKPIVLSLNL